MEASDLKRTRDPEDENRQLKRMFADLSSETAAQTQTTNAEIFSDFLVFSQKFMLIVLTTVADETEAEHLARKIIEAKLAACVQILPTMKSIYFWENAVQSETENLLLIKTLAENYDALESFIQAHHSYETPEIVAVSAEKFRVIISIG